MHRDAVEKRMMQTVNAQNIIAKEYKRHSKLYDLSLKNAFHFELRESSASIKQLVQLRWPSMYTTMRIFTYGGITLDAIFNASRILTAAAKE